MHYHQNGLNKRITWIILLKGLSSTSHRPLTGQYFNKSMNNQQINTRQNSTYSQKFAVFIPVILFQIWLSHALCFFPHEFSHSIVAWLLGWKTNPLALNFAHPSVAVLLAQFGINENVNYEPIFATGHGWQAAIIAAAGMAIGNMLITYPLSRWFYRIAKRLGSRNWAMLFYLATVASIGNFWDYVPIRIFATGGDMHTIARGFECSPWLVLLVLGTPTALALVYFFRKIETDTLSWLFPNSATQRGLLIILTSLGLFGFYGAAGWAEDLGPESKWLSILSIFVIFPLMTVYGFWRLKKTERLQSEKKMLP
jgi:hypothetical protein